MAYNYKGYKKTDLVTIEFGKRRIVYEKDGKLYYRYSNTWHGTFKEYCWESGLSK